MDLKKFMELENIKAHVALILRNELDIEARESVINPAARRIYAMLDDLNDIIDKHGGDKAAVILFDTMLHSLMLQDVMIELQSEALGTQDEV